MLSMHLKRQRSEEFRILCIGAHCDDIEIGCGGTVMKWLQEHKNISVDWIVFSKDRERVREARKSGGLFLKGAKGKNITIKNFRNGFFPYVGAQIKEYFERLKKDIAPDIIFTHYRDDFHQDHRLLSELTWNTFRNHLILEYEIPKYDGDMGSPNVYIPLNEELCREKIRILTSIFTSQKNKHWFTEEVFWSVLRLRGMESCSESNYAEGFYCRKICL